MKLRKDISIVPAKGGFVVEYNNVVYGTNTIGEKFGIHLEIDPHFERVIEVVQSEAKMIKLLREILQMQTTYEDSLINKTQQLNETLG